MIYPWAVIGAGPAGIAAIGKLLDHGIASNEIAWVDPAFTVGDFGTIWSNVHSNTSVELFLKFLHACEAFNYKNCSEDFAINSTSPQSTCELRLMAAPLQWVSNNLQKKVIALHDFAETLFLQQSAWTIKLRKTEIRAKQVILAIGAEPKNLSYACSKVIPLQDALDSHRLRQHISQNNTIGVFGSSHSAILALRNLVEYSVKKIINFYQIPLMYAVPFDDWILFDNTGLKGPTADWARTYLHSDLLNLQRIYSNTENIASYLPQCDKVIYAVGFERRAFPRVEGLECLSYMEKSGIIAPGLFGLGIAFPQAKQDPLGQLEYRVGLWKFMDYLQQILPIWMKYVP